MTQDTPSIAAIIEGLSEAQKRRIKMMPNGEMPAGAIGATGSDSTRLMREFNRNGLLVVREYRGGRNRYHLSGLGLSVRTALQEQ